MKKEQKKHQTGIYFPSVGAVSLFSLSGVQAVREKVSIINANTAQRMRLDFIIYLVDGGIFERQFP